MESSREEERTAKWIILTSIWITQGENEYLWANNIHRKVYKKCPTDAWKKIFSPRSSLESSLGGLWRFRCDKLDEWELLLVLLLMLLMFSKLCCGGPPKCGRVRNGANIGMPNWRNGAHGRDRGAKWAATAASWRAGCNPGGPPDMFDNKLWCPNTIILMVETSRCLTS